MVVANCRLYISPLEEKIRIKINKKYPSFKAKVL